MVPFFMPLPRRLPLRAQAILILLALEGASHAQLRIVTYNTATGNPAPGVQTARAGSDVVLAAIGEEMRNGFAKPIDVLLLQEQYTTATSTQSFVDMLNGIYGTVQNPTPYARGTLNALTSDPDRRAGGPGLVYNTQTVELLQELHFGSVSGSAQARSTLRYQLRPVGYGPGADFYAYNDHYKSSTGSENVARRLLEAQSVRANADALGEGAHIIYAGDFNIQSSNENMYDQALLGPGPGQAFDPIDTPGSWNSNSSLRHIHTQSPVTSPRFSGQITGGIDDRFDFQLVTGEMLDGEGLSYIPGSYRAFGNNGSHACCNSEITSGNGASTNVLNALTTASDHLPVVADYQLPAIMQALAGPLPETLGVGEAFSFNVFVSNAANVAAAIGADELDYSLTTSGAVLGSFLNQGDMALGSENVHSLQLDTSSPGMKTGTITISSTSQAVQNGLIQIPISFQVVAEMLAGDFNDDGVVDAADYVAWRKKDGTPSGYELWRTNFGATSAAAVAPAAVPEPSGWLLATAAGCWAALRRSKLRAWSRKPLTSI